MEIIMGAIAAIGAAAGSAGAAAGGAAAAGTAAAGGAAFLGPVVTASGAIGAAGAVAAGTSFTVGTTAAALGAAATGATVAAAGGLTFAKAAAGLALFGGLVTGVGQYMSQKSQRDYASAQARLDAAQADYAAASIRTQGEKDVTASKRRLAMATGATKAQVARTGLVLGGSALDLLFSMESDANLEQEDIRQATERKAYGYDTTQSLSSVASSSSGGSLLLSVTGGILNAGSAATRAYGSLNPQSAKGVLAQ